MRNLLFKSWQVRVGGGGDHVIKEWQVLVNVLKNVMSEYVCISYKRSGKISTIREGSMYWIDQALRVTSTGYRKNLPSYPELKIYQLL